MTRTKNKMVLDTSTSVWGDFKSYQEKSYYRHVLDYWWGLAGWFIIILQ